MRIVWKDSATDIYKPTKYRGYNIEGGYAGWYTDIPGDDNLYKTVYDAKNSIDEQLGDIDKLKYAKRREHGIQIVGKRNKIG